VKVPAALADERLRMPIIVTHHDCDDYDLEIHAPGLASGAHVDLSIWDDATSAFKLRQRNIPTMPSEMTDHVTLRIPNEALVRTRRDQEESFAVQIRQPLGDFNAQFVIVRLPKDPGEGLRREIERLVRENESLRTDIETLRAENARLRGRIEGLLHPASQTTGLQTVPIELTQCWGHVNGDADMDTEDHDAEVQVRSSFEVVREGDGERLDLVVSFSCRQLGTKHPQGTTAYTGEARRKGVYMAPAGMRIVRVDQGGAPFDSGLQVLRKAKGQRDLYGWRSLPELPPVSHWRLIEVQVDNSWQTSSPVGVRGEIAFSVVIEPSPR
jgi:hypothetical protein